MERLRPEDFALEANRAVYEAAVRLSARGDAVDPVMIKTETEKAGNGITSQYLLELMDATPTAANVMEYAEQVRDQSLRRGVAALAADIQGRASDMAEDPHALLSELITNANGLEQEGTTKGLISPMELATRWMDHRMKVESGKSAAYVPTGYRDYDYILGGGLIASGMHVLAARPGMGKTTFALNIADRVASRVGPVLFVSLEMDDEQIQAKRLARESGISGNRLLMGKLSEEENEKMAQAMEKLSSCPTHVNRKPSATVAEIYTLARQVPGLVLIVVDYLGKISPGDRGRLSRYEYTTEISGEIKTMARTFKVPVLVLCQINREAEKRSEKRPNLSDLRDTGAVEQDADTVTFLYRQDYYGNPADRDPYMPQETDCIVAKNRHAGVGECKLDMYAATSKFVTTNTDPRSGYRKALQTGNA